MEVAAVVVVLVDVARVVEQQIEVGRIVADCCRWADWEQIEVVAAADLVDVARVAGKQIEVGRIEARLTVLRVEVGQLASAAGPVANLLASQAGLEPVAAADVVVGVVAR